MRLSAMDYTGLCGIKAGNEGNKGSNKEKVRAETINNLKPVLDGLYEKYSLSYLSSDPVFFPHQYEDPRDIEISALISSALAYGKVDLFMPKISYILSLMGRSPYQYIVKTDLKSEHRLDDFVYRFNRGPDIIRLLSVLQDTIINWGSIESLFMDGYAPDSRDIGQALQSFVSRILEYDGNNIDAGLEITHGFRHLFPRPGKAACKRLNMFLRWMIRSDKVDFGIWKGIKPSQLIMPIDTHIARLSGYLGMSRRKAADWKMAEEVTEVLRLFDPNDPVKYDFALSRLGILNECPTRKTSMKCQGCSLYGLCLRPS